MQSRILRGAAMKSLADGHKESILIDIANCHGLCEALDPEKLRFIKIQECGLIVQRGG